MNALKAAKKQRLKYYAGRVFGENHKPDNSAPEAAIQLTIEALYIWQKCIGQLLRHDGRIYDKIVEDQKSHGTPHNPEKITIALLALQLAKESYISTLEVIIEADDPKFNQAFDNLKCAFEREIKRLNRSTVITATSPALTPSRRLMSRSAPSRQPVGHS